MHHHQAAVIELAGDLIALDSRSSRSNLPVADRIEAALPGFEIERLDYADAAGTPKRALVARRGRPGGLALSGHMDTVPDTGWQEDPWSGHLADGRLHGLGSTDMKGPVAAAIIAARALPPDIAITLLITTDEETTKAGARAIVERSQMMRDARPSGILIVEPTGMVPVRGHRAHTDIAVTATGVQAHSSTGQGHNANWDLIPFLVEMKALFQRLRDDPALHDRAYDPPFSDFNLVLDNHGTAVNVTVPRADARLKFRYSAAIDPAPVVALVAAAAERAGLSFRAERQGQPMELPPDHPLVVLCAKVTTSAPTTAPYGTDAALLQALAPCVILGPGDISSAHRPGESVSIRALVDAIPVFQQLAIASADSLKEGVLF